MLQRKGSPDSAPESAGKRNLSLTEGPPQAGLQFDFPGFQLQASSTKEDPQIPKERDLLQDLDDLEGEEHAAPEYASLAAIAPACPRREGSGTPYLPDLPDDVLFKLLSACRIADVLNLGQTCKTLHSLTRQNEVWEGRVDGPEAVIEARKRTRRHAEFAAEYRRYWSSIKSTPKIPRGTPGLELFFVKNLTLGERKREALGMDRFEEVYCIFRAMSCQIWTGDHPLDTMEFRVAVMQMTRFDWNHSYDAVCLAFRHMADVVALELLAEVGAEGSLWPRLLDYWDGFYMWVRHVVGECIMLDNLISKIRSIEWGEKGSAATPSLNSCGKLAFRTQVLLKYELRGRLQKEALDAIGGSGVLEEGELKAMKTLLRRLDVADDETASKVMQTRDTYRESYGLEPGALQLTS